MDYIKIFNEIFLSVLDKKEKYGKEQLHILKKEDRPLEFAFKKINDFYLKKLIDHEKKSDFKLGKYASLFDTRKELYSNEAGKKMILNELLNAFTAEYQIDNYPTFLKELATRYALKRAFLCHNRNKSLTAYLYYYDEIQKFSLKRLEDTHETEKMFNEYDSRSRTFYIRDPLREDYEIEPKLELQLRNELENKSRKGKIEIEINSEKRVFPAFEENEKLLLIHFLLHLESMSNAEKAKIIFLIGETDSGHTLFDEKAKNNIYYNKVRQGPEYYGKDTGIQLLLSVLDKTKLLGLTTLTSAVKLALHRAKN